MRARVQTLRADYEPLVTAGEARTLVATFDSDFKAYVATEEPILAVSRKLDKLTASDLFNDKSRETYDAASKALNDVIDLNGRETKVAADRGAATYASARNWIFGALAIAALVCAMSGWLIVRGVSRPITAMTGVMRRLAGRDMAVEIAGQQRKDEIGAMAVAVQVFKDNMLAADRLAAEQAEKDAAKVTHARAIEALTQAFEAKVGEMVGAVASAATEMEATARSMVATAEQTNQQSTTVAVASEQTSVNVQTVATATEELSSSVQEIGRQVARSTQVAGKAVEEAKHTDATVQTACRRRAEDRRGGDDHPRHRRQDQSAGVERDDRGGARRRCREGVRRGGVGGEGAGQSDRQGNRGDQQPDRADPGRDAADGDSHPKHCRNDCRDQRDRRQHRLGGGAAERGDAGDLTECARGGARHPGGVEQHRRREAGSDRHRARRQTRCSARRSRCRGRRRNSAARSVISLPT